MAGKKFYALTVLWLFMAAIFAGGCGGGSSSSTIPTTDPTPITSPDKTPTPITSPDITPTPTPITSPDITPTPTPITSPDITPTPTPIISPDTDLIISPDNEHTQPEETSTDLFMAEYAANEIVISYAQGDNPNYVTQNLTLPAKIYSADISWTSSNPAVISPSGVVTRPNGFDSDVTLTATAEYGTESASKDFTVRLIRARSRLSSDIEIVDVQSISSGEISIRYNDSSDMISDIEGNYSAITIQNADDALDAVQAIHNQLGISNPYEELKTSVVTSDSSGAEYQFTQIHNGIKVYGYGLMVSANSAGKGDFLHANLLSSDILDSLDKAINEGRINLTLKTSHDAENAVKGNYSGNVEVNSADTEMIIFALGEYENSPVYAYIVNVSGVQDNGGYVNEAVIISAVSGNVIWKSTSINEAHHSIRTSKTVTCENESGDKVSFPVKLSNGWWNMIDDMEEPIIEIYSGDCVPDMPNFLGVPTTLVRLKPGQENGQWDSQAVSAYTNMREILRWWRDTFGRNSLDDKGMAVKIIVHQYTRKEKDGSITKDNACWANYDEKFYISDKRDRARSSASAVDVLTHESTHAVLQYVTGIKNWGEESPLRAITEGYADVFACIKDKNWTIAEDLSPNYRLRDIAAKYTGSFPTDAYVDSVHYVSYLAYLMHKNGLTWDELGKIWYKSMSMGYQSKFLFRLFGKDSNFDDVHRCVRCAAEKLAEAGEIPREKLLCVYDALGEIFYSPASISGTITDYSSGLPVADALVGVNFSSSSYYQDRSEKTDSKGRYSRRLYNEDGKCHVTVTADGYSAAEIYGVEVKAPRDNVLNVRLVKQGYGYLSGTVRNASDDSPLVNVLVAIKPGFNSAAGFAYSETSTDINGRYSFDADSISTGHYTVEFRKTGFKTTTQNVIITGNSTELDGQMSTGKSFRHDISKIDVEIDINTLVSGSSGKGWRCTNGELHLYESMVYKINGNGTATTNRIKLGENVDAAVILNNVNIDVSGTDYACAFDVTSADIELFIQGENSLKSGKTRAGLEVPDGASITISSIHDDNTDSLNAEGGYHGTGIGGPGSDSDRYIKGRAALSLFTAGQSTQQALEAAQALGAPIPFQMTEAASS